MSFRNRWRIEGTLTTLEPLHIGDGGTLSPEERDQRDLPSFTDSGGVERPVEVSTVATFSRHGKHIPYLPGTTLKGVLRSWISPRVDADGQRLVSEVFGSEDPATPNAVGGKAEFWNALAEGEPPSLEHVPYPDRDRWTGVIASVGIDRRTRTASPGKLFYEEFVPPGASFRVVIAGQDLDEAEIDVVLLALEGFNHDADPVRIGAETNNGRGRMSWELKAIHRLEGQAAISAWLDDSANQGGFHGLPPLPRQEDVDRFRARAVHARRAVSCPRAILSLDLELQFEGPFLVNEPDRAKRAKADKSDTRPNHAPRIDHQGRIVLPSRSIRGAFRSQAEKIIRTLEPRDGGDPHRPDNRCDAVQELAEVGNLSLAAQVFGAPGWRAAVEFSDFTARDDPPIQRQEFVAIDRFTGGAAHRLKFNVEYADRPCLRGTMRVDLHRVKPWALGLIALTLRDLIEGDITFGLGASKGYGACQAKIRSVGPPSHFGDCSQWAEAWGLPGLDWQQPLTSLLETDYVQLALVSALEDLHNRLGLNHGVIHA